MPAQPTCDEAHADRREMPLTRCQTWSATRIARQ